MTTNQDADRIAELERDNRRLRELLDRRDAPGELRHRLRNTLSLLRTVIRRSSETGRDFRGYVDQLEDRLDAIVRVQALADLHGTVDLRTLFQEELFQYGVVDGDGLALSGPDIHLQPRAGQVLALAVHELAVNALEHGALGKEKGRIDVVWRLEARETGPWLQLVWSEAGSAINPSGDRQGFGTEVLTRMLAYDIKASTTITYEPDGLKVVLDFPLPPQVGVMAAR